ncbi:transglutaminase domain-containing protein [Actinoplanes flavus]|uniref:Transglutaminase domain-containing protein n=1 Tax=Actinoplanes flavus TaxID=2820290 RepID=A0ABS3UDA4_9ACTN|nr:transglutaminase domain-containing protein [Actinoplanes flavus]MBO3736747.1 transglutaminase domain-containing protein [Actinoplanes flavus]
MVTRVLRRAVVPVALAGMLMLAGAALGGIYADGLLFRLVAGAAIGSVTVGVAARRLPSWTVAPISAALLGGYAALALSLAAGDDGLTLTVARDALANGIPRLLTAMIPIEPTPDTVIIAVGAVWVAGLAATEIAVRGGRVLLGCLPPALVYAGALYVVGPNASAATTSTLTFAGLVVAALASTSVTGATSHAAVRARALGGAAAGLAVVLGLIAATGPWIAGRVTATPVDPRRYVQPPRVDSLDESPLNRISGWALDPAQQLLEFRPGLVPAAAPRTTAPAVSASAAPGRPRASGKPGASDRPAAPGQPEVRLRLAVLSDYDGVTWRVGGIYRNAGRVLPAPTAPAGVRVAESQQQITITGLTGRLLPAVPTPTRITGARVAYDAATGTLIRPEGLSDGLRYTALSQTQTPDLGLLPIAEVPSGDAWVRYLKVGPNTPQQIEGLAEHLAEGYSAAYDRAVVIEQFLAEHYRHVADAPSGHAYPNLAHFLFGRRDLGGQKGTSEQFAAAYALLARLTGLPSRVVVGFTAPAAGGAVTAGDALAWPEVYFDGVGWVAFDPMPKSDTVRPVEEDYTPPKPTPPPSPSDTPAPTAEESSAPPSAVVAAPTAGGPSTVLVASGASGGVVFVLVGAALAVVSLRSAQRRRRLTFGDPAQRITGAWLEFTDALRLAGHPVPSHLSATEAAGHASALPPPSQRTGLLRRAVPVTPPAPAPEPAPLPPLDALVDAINTAGFAPEAADAGQADRAGEQAVAYATALRARRNRWQRMLWTVRPGPLRWNRPPGGKPPG